jgi:hypothetical protein
MFRIFSYNQRMAVRHRRNEKKILKRTRGLDAEDLTRAEGEVRWDYQQATLSQLILMQMMLDWDVR